MVTYKLIATDNPFIPDNECINFFSVDSDDLVYSVNELSNEINSLSNFYVSSSVTSSYEFIYSSSFSQSIEETVINGVNTIDYCRN